MDIAENDSLGRCSLLLIPCAIVRGHKVPPYRSKLWQRIRGVFQGCVLDRWGGVECKLPPKER